MKSKHLLFALIPTLLFVVLTIFSWPMVRLALVDWTLKDYGTQTVGIEFHYDKITFDERGDFLLHNPILKKEGIGTLTASRGYLNVKFDLRNRELVTHITLNPCTLQATKEWVLTPLPSYDHFFRPSFTLEAKGTLLYPEGGEEAIAFTFFSGDETGGTVILEGAEVTFTETAANVHCTHYPIKTPLQLHPHLTITGGNCSGTLSFKGGKWTGEGVGTACRGILYGRPFSVGQISIGKDSLTLEEGEIFSLRHLSGALQGDLFGDWESAVRGEIFSLPFEGSFARKGGVLAPGSGLHLLSQEVVGGVVVEEGETARYTFEGKGSFLSALAPTLPFSLEKKRFGFEGVIEGIKSEGVFTLLQKGKKEHLIYCLTPEMGKFFSEEITLQTAQLEGKTKLEGFFNREEFKIALSEGSLQYGEKGWSLREGLGSRTLIEHKWGTSDWHWATHFKNGTFSFFHFPLFSNSLNARLEGTQSEVTLLELQSNDHMQGKIYLNEIVTIPFGESYTLPLTLSDLSNGPIEHFSGHLTLSPSYSLLEGSGAMTIGDTAWPFVLDHLSIGIDQTMVFDAWAGLNNEDLLRLSGSAVPGEEGLEVSFRPSETHFGTFYPTIFNTKLSWEGNIKSCSLRTSGGFQSLSPFSTTLSEWGVGQANLAIEKQEEKPWTFKVENMEVKKALVSLEGNWSCPIFTVDFCGIKEENALTIGLEGYYNLETKKGKAHVHHFEASLETLAPHFHLSHLDPKGVLKATEGVLEGTPSNYDLSLCASLEDFSLLGYPFQNTENIHLVYSGERMIILSDIRSTLSRDEEAISLALKHLRLDIEKDELEIKGLEFSLLKSQKVPLPTLETFLHAIQPESGLAGTLNYSQTPFKSELDIHFDKGVYWVGEAPLLFDTLSLHKSQEKISVDGMAKVFGRVGCFHTSWLEKSFPNGTLTVSFPPTQDQLELEWSLFPTLSAENLRGIFYGQKIQEGLVLSPVFCANLSFENECAVLENIIWKKWSGEIDCPKATVTFGGELSAPRLYAHGIVPPNIAEWSGLIDPSFSVEYGEITDFHCSLDSLSQARGAGEFTFTSKPRNSPKNLALFREKYPPNSSFKPCTGGVAFKLGEGKIEFLSFQDVLDPLRVIRFSPGISYFDLETLAAHLLISLEPNQPKVRLGEKKAIAVEGSLAEPTIQYR